MSGVKGDLVGVGASTLLSACDAPRDYGPDATTWHLSAGLMLVYTRH